MEIELTINRSAESIAYRAALESFSRSMVQKINVEVSRTII